MSNLFEKMEYKEPNKNKYTPKNNDYNQEIWSDLSTDERSIYYISEAFNKFMRQRDDKKNYLPSARVKTVQRVDKHGDECRPADIIRNHKNWQYFERLWERFENDSNFKADEFMDSLNKHISKSTKIYPSQLCTKKNIDNYMDYRMSLKITSNTDNIKVIMTGIASSYKTIKKHMKVETLTSDDLYNFFNVPQEGNLLSDGFLLVMREMISPHYYAVSRSFLRAYRDTDPDIREELISEDRLRDMASLVKIRTQVYGFNKKVFGDDIL